MVKYSTLLMLACVLSSTIDPVYAQQSSRFCQNHPDKVLSDIRNDLVAHGILNGIYWRKVDKEDHTTVCQSVSTFKEIPTPLPLVTVSFDSSLTKPRPMDLTGTVYAPPTMHADALQAYLTTQVDTLQLLEKLESKRQDLIDNHKVHNIYWGPSITSENQHLLDQMLTELGKMQGEFSHIVIIVSPDISAPTPISIFSYTELPLGMGSDAIEQHLRQGVPKYEPVPDHMQAHASLRTALDEQGTVHSILWRDVADHDLGRLLPALKELGKMQKKFPTIGVSFDSKLTAAQPIDIYGMVKLPLGMAAHAMEQHFDKQTPIAKQLQGINATYDALIANYTLKDVRWSKVKMDDISELAQSLKELGSMKKKFPRVIVIFDSTISEPKTVDKPQANTVYTIVEFPLGMDASAMEAYLASL